MAVCLNGSHVGSVSAWDKLSGVLRQTLGNITDPRSMRFDGSSSSRACNAGTKAGVTCWSTTQCEQKLSREGYSKADLCSVKWRTLGGRATIAEISGICQLNQFGPTSLSSRSTSVTPSRIKQSETLLRSPNSLPVLLLHLPSPRRHWHARSRAPIAVSSLPFRFSLSQPVLSIPHSSTQRAAVIFSTALTAGRRFGPEIREHRLRQHDFVNTTGVCTTDIVIVFAARELHGLQFIALTLYERELERESKVYADSGDEIRRKTQVSHWPMSNSSLEFGRYIEMLDSRIANAYKRHFTSCSHNSVLGFSIAAFAALERYSSHPSSGGVTYDVPDDPVQLHDMWTLGPPNLQLPIPILSVDTSVRIWSPEAILAHVRTVLRPTGGVHLGSPRLAPSRAVTREAISQTVLPHSCRSFIHAKVEGLEGYMELLTTSRSRGDCSCRTLETRLVFRDSCMARREFYLVLAGAVGLAEGGK
ncbi:hypothetical protein EDB84DRAFT_1681986 [Lactarius hengduanensis]|nr:hypothetical protein EDB84DRAFT_1681986 [Lactarius hengduanensis]